MIPLANQHTANTVTLAHMNRGGKTTVVGNMLNDMNVDVVTISWAETKLNAQVWRQAGEPYATARILADYASRWALLPLMGCKLSTFLDMVHTARIGLQFQGEVYMQCRVVDQEGILSASRWHIEPMNSTWRYNYIMNQSAYLDTVAQMVIQQLNIFPPVEILTYDSLAAGAQEQEPWHTPESALKASKFIADNELLALDREKVRKYLDGEWDAGDYAKLRKDK